MIKELFEKAKFGDRFVTRGGQEALFLRLTENSEWQFADFYVKDWGQIRVNRENGKCINGPDMENDIVGMMPSLPSGLDEAAEEYVKDYGYTEDDYKRERIIAEEHFKAGAEWMAGQGVTVKKKIGKIDDGVNQIPTYCNGFEITELDVPFLNSKECGYGNEVIVQIRKKQ